MIKIAKWFYAYQAPAVLMIDDLSDAYIDVYSEVYRNDWGYLCDGKGSAYSFLQNNLLKDFPDVKITFFVPYLRHNAINENSQYEYKKFSLGDRAEYTSFLKRLVEEGHEIAHHGSDHGKYIDEMIPTTVNNWNHEWTLYSDVETGMRKTLEGVKRFKETCVLDVLGGKYCGYKSIENSQEIIDRCRFLYWCEKTHFDLDEYSEASFGKNKVISFPTTFAGNSFVRLSYITGNRRKDVKKKFLRFFQPFYDIYSYIRLLKLYKNGHIISVQEHISPSKTSGQVQSANIISDIKSLKKIFIFLKNYSIWYANCKEIAKYIYVRDNCKIVSQNNGQLVLSFDDYKGFGKSEITLVDSKSFEISQDDVLYRSTVRKRFFVVNLQVENGDNVFSINYL